jgi:DNA-binding beta-propeller fold protein YncE
MRTVRTLKVFFGTVLVATTWALPASALTAEVATRDASLVGESFTFKTVVSDATGNAQYRYNFGDGTQTDFEVGRSEISHTYQDPGHYPLIITVKDDGGGFAGASFIHTVHYPVLPGKPTVSTDIVYDEPRNRIYNVNRDADSITVVDPVLLKKLAEVPVYRDPEALALAPDKKLWVLHRDDYAIAIVDPDKLTIERGLRLPYASQPIGLAMSPTGDAAYVTLAAVGKLLKLNPTTGAIIGELDVGPRPRGVSVSHDGKDVYVTRFISSDAGGEVVHVDGPSLKVVKRFDLVPDTTTIDTDQKGRGLPNYLFSVGLSPDGREAWVPGKKDNIFRGTLRDNQALSQDNTVRPLVAVLDLAMGAEDLAHRIDLDDRNLPTHVEFSPLGDYAFVTVTGSNLIEVRDVYTKLFVTAMKEAGLSPRGSVLGPQNRLFVHGSLTRKLVVYDMTDIVTWVDVTTKRLTEISTVEKEKFDPQQLLGKQLFYNSADGRMTVEGYLSCATCHFDGDDDGRVFDFTSRGEGLRNTTSLLGRRGTGEGRVHWSGNFDEIQDFENEIRGLFNGSGFMTDEAFESHKDPLGAPKAGVSPELDAIAAFVKTLDHVNPSPYRNPDGSMTAAALAGKVLFAKLGCDFCHVAPDYTDSARGILHDVGTLKPSSGKRSDGPLLGIDTPTLLGVWETAPYLHDGSAATLRDVLTTANANDGHAFVSALSPAQVDQLVAFVQQLDNELPVHKLPFEADMADAGPSDAQAGSADAAPPILSPAPAAKGCACEVATIHEERGIWAAWALAPLLVLHGRRRNRKGQREVER